MEIFTNWRKINRVDKIDEDVMLAYVSELVSLEVSVTQISLIMDFYLVQEVWGVFSFDKNIYGGDHVTNVRKCRYLFLFSSQVFYEAYYYLVQDTYRRCLMYVL
jgi:hypothetical protein